MPILPTSSLEIIKTNEVWSPEISSACTHWYLISLHRETICDAAASWSGWKFGSKIKNPENWNLGRSWDFWVLTCPEYPLPPWQLKLMQILALCGFWVLTCPEYPPTPHPRNWNLGRSWHLGLLSFDLPRIPLLPPFPKLKFRQILALWDFWVLTCPEYPLPPPPEIEI